MIIACRPRRMKTNASTSPRGFLFESIRPCLDRTMYRLLEQLVQHPAADAYRSPFDALVDGID